MLVKWLVVMVIFLLAPVLGAAGGTSEALKVGFIIGADVIATQSGSPAPVQAAQQRGAYGIGFNADASKFAPEKYLVSAMSWGLEVA
jgi:hypothetical protein